MARIHTVYGDDESFIRSYIKAQKPIKEKTRLQITKQFWNSMNSRVKKGIYLKKGIQVEWSFDEFDAWLQTKWDIYDNIKKAGEVPSIDRINSNGNYCASNCRLIPNSVNSALGEVNALVVRMRQLQEFLKENSHWL